MIEHADELPHAGKRKYEVDDAFKYKPPAKKRDETAPIRSKRRVRYRDGKPRDKLDKRYDEYERAAVPEFRDRRHERFPADHDDEPCDDEIEPEKLREKYGEFIHAPKCTVHSQKIFSKSADLWKDALFARAANSLYTVRHEYSYSTNARADGRGEDFHGRTGVRYLLAPFKGAHSISRRPHRLRCRKSRHRTASFSPIGRPQKRYLVLHQLSRRPCIRRARHPRHDESHPAERLDGLRRHGRLDGRRASFGRRKRQAVRASERRDNDPSALRRRRGNGF